MAQPELDRTPVAGCLARLFWMFGGILALTLLALSTFHSHSFSIRDLGFWLIVLFLVITRFVDIRYLQGQTAEGEPATICHWRRHSLGLLASSTEACLLLHGSSRIFG